ncbi:hypothetical protein F4778DRAFT_28569 [Xylariomycetidae sp. FL2044]|nr:hypothetical protein F4778DRAFT_28569 [Xylariomycetidae sp. FL2044]
MNGEIPRKVIYYCWAVTNPSWKLSGQRRTSRNAHTYSRRAAHTSGIGSRANSNGARQLGIGIGIGIGIAWLLDECDGVGGRGMIYKKGDIHHPPLRTPYLFSIPVTAKALNCNALLLPKTPSLVRSLNATDDMIPIRVAQPRAADNGSRWGTWSCHRVSNCVISSYVAPGHNPNIGIGELPAQLKATGPRKCAAIIELIVYGTRIHQDPIMAYAHT